MSKFPWDEKSIARMGALIDDGRSSGEAAAILSVEFRHTVSRSAVMSKSAALGLHFKSTNRNARSTKVAAPKVKNSANCVKREIAPKILRERPALVAPALVAAPLPADVALPESRRVMFVELTSAICRWPIGDPRAEEFRFCGALGADLAAGRPYCPRHAAAAYAERPARKVRAA